MDYHYVIILPDPLMKKDYLIVGQYGDGTSSLWYLLPKNHRHRKSILMEHNLISIKLTKPKLRYQMVTNEDQITVNNKGIVKIPKESLSTRRMLKHIIRKQTDKILIIDTYVLLYSGHMKRICKRTLIAAKDDGQIIQKEKSIKPLDWMNDLQTDIDFCCHPYNKHLWDKLKITPLYEGVNIFVSNEESFIWIKLQHTWVPVYKYTTEYLETYAPEHIKTEYQLYKNIITNK